jgi:ADP-ribosylglycohydrolase
LKEGLVHGMAAARRSLDGLSIGDAFGERFFGPPETVRRRIDSRVFPSGRLGYTDDTVMALSVVEVLERFGRIDQDELARRFARKFERDPTRGYGGTAFGILDAICQGGDWRALSRAAFGGAGSMGNGAAMRAAPIGAYHGGSLRETVEDATLSAAVTHGHPDGQAGAVAVAVAASHLAGGGALDDLFEVVIAHVPAGATRDGVRKAAELPRTSGVGRTAALLGSGQRVLSQDTVPFCLWCAHRSGGDYVEALWLTVAGLGDRDTTCAIVGGIVASMPGASIPEAWRAAREPLEVFAERSSRR